MAPHLKTTACRSLFLPAAILAIASASLLPVLAYSTFAAPIDDRFHETFKVALLVIPFLLVLICYKSDTFSENKKPVFVLLILLTLMLVDVHYVYIDTTSNYFKTITNHEWQLELHENIMRLDPGSIPHSYRFLPDSFARLVEFLTGDFSYARSFYRHTFMFMLLYSIYYYAMLYCRQSTAVLSVLFYAAVYPISIRFYAGQLTDPMSHLLFVWSFIFAERDDFTCFSLVVLFGILAKESIVIMPVYYLLLKLKTGDSLAKPVLLIIVSAAVVLSVRSLIAADMEYENISGVEPSHIMNNLAQYEIWSRQLAYTLGIFIPFFILSWKTSHARLRDLVLFLLPPLILSNIMFSWLHESRNFIPVVIPMAIITSDYLLYKTSDIK